jgi:drug/metabolite transporter (DMT)-like permease
MVSVRSRWRYVATLAVALFAGVVYVAAGDATVGSVAIGTVALAVAGAAAAAYLLVESVDAYRSSVSTGDAAPDDRV